MRPLRSVLALAAVAILGACAQADPTLRVVSPRDGTQVTSPVRVEVEVEDFRLTTAGTPQEGSGHLHVLVDVGCAEPGKAIPSDDAHQHLWRGESGMTLELAPGEHTLCIQAADGQHVALDLSKQVTITVDEE